LVISNYNTWKVSVKADNRYVVPFNPLLLLLFDCHINVEMCSSVRACKYIFKYIFKVRIMWSQRGGRALTKPSSR